VSLMMGGMVEDVLAGRPHEPIPTFPQDPDNRLALAFSEALILCPDKGAVKSRMDKDMPGACAFIKVAERAIDNIKNGQLSLAPRKNYQQTPFFLLASLVLEHLQSKQ